MGMIVLSNLHRHWPVILTAAEGKFMYIVIVGDGKVGTSLTKHLSAEGYDVAVIDKDPEVIEEAVNTYDVIGVCGNGANYQVQLEAGVDKADIFIAVTSSDEINIFCCLTAKKLGARHTVARVRNPDYRNQLIFMREELGLSMVVNPERDTAVEIARMISSPATITRDVFSRGRMELAELKIGETNPLRERTLASLKQHNLKVLVCAVQRDDDVYIPSGNFTLKASDKIYVTGSPKNLNNFIEFCGLGSTRIKDVMIIGGGKITYYLAQRLEELGVQMKIIEQDRQRCLELSRNLKRAEIIHGDGANQDLLLEEGLERAGALISLTDMDEENIVISMYARSLGVEKIITKVNSDAFSRILESLEIGSIVSPKETVVNRILPYVRAMHNAAESSNVETLYKIVGGQVEALEFKVKENARYTGVPLKKLAIKPNILIAGIVRDDAVIIPSGDDFIQKMDSVIIVTTNTAIGDLGDILD